MPRFPTEISMLSEPLAVRELLPTTSSSYRRSCVATDKTPDDLFLDTLKDLSYAGKQIAKSLPKNG